MRCGRVLWCCFVVAVCEYVCAYAYMIFCVHVSGVLRVACSCCLRCAISVCMSGKVGDHPFGEIPILNETVKNSPFPLCSYDVVTRLTDHLCHHYMVVS